MERADGKVFKTAVVIDRSGAIVGSYRKRKPVATEKITPGAQNFFFDMPELRGRVAVLICFDIENADILKEVLDERPVLILNPVHISDASGTSSDPRVVSLTWRNAVASMRRKLEKTAYDNDMDIVRADMPVPHGAGSSQAIGSCRTVLGHSAADSFFLADVWPRGSPMRNFVGSEPDRPRTATEDNTFNRLLLRSVRSGTAEGTLTPSSFCNIPTPTVSSSQPTGDIAIAFSDGSIRLWDRVASSFTPLTLPVLFCRPSSTSWRGISWDHESRSVLAISTKGETVKFEHPRKADFSPSHGVRAASSTVSNVTISGGDLVAKSGEILVAAATFGPFNVCGSLASSMVVGGTSTGNLVFYNTFTNTLHHVSQVSDVSVTRLECAPDNLYIITMDENNAIHCLEFTQHNFLATPSKIFTI